MFAAHMQGAQSQHTEANLHAAVGVYKKLLHAAVGVYKKLLISPFDNRKAAVVGMQPRLSSQACQQLV